MAFTPRFTRPEAGNKYYIRRASGGYSTAIAGKPVDPDCDVLHNCVGYAVGRFHEIAGREAFDLLDAVNAERLFDNARQHGLQVGMEPALGALIVWQKGATLSGSDGAGHVAVVEAIEADGSIQTSESGYGAKQAFWMTRRKPPYDGGAGYTLLGFVYQPAVSHAEGVGKAIRRGHRGKAVRLMQQALAERGYLRRNEVDGDFGVITMGALLAFQYENGLAVDGVCGAMTQGALQLHP